MRLVTFQGRSPKIDSLAYVAESAVLIGDVKVGPYSSVWENTVLRADWNSITIGSHTSIQDNCTIHVTLMGQTVIGNYVTMGHNSMIHGATIGSNTIIGISSVVLDNAVIEDFSMVGAGAVVPPKTVVPSKHIALGIPAKIREFKGDPSIFQLMADGYVQLAQEYRKENTEHQEPE
ncbi:MAG: gamma carbonic anhydrase family protein [Candidatus Heimdallarchaeota archaeon]